MLSSEENGPCDTAGVLALEEEGFGLAILEAEDLAISTNVELALFFQLSAPITIALTPSCFSSVSSYRFFVLIATVYPDIAVFGERDSVPYLSRVDLLAGEGIVVGTHVDYTADGGVVLFVVRIVVDRVDGESA